MAAKTGGTAQLFVVNATVLTVTVLLQMSVDVKAIPVILTTFEAPAELNEEVVNDPVPGEPAVKLMVAVVLLTVLVPLTL